MNLFKKYIFAHFLKSGTRKGKAKRIEKKKKIHKSHYLNIAMFNSIID